MVNNSINNNILSMNGSIISKTEIELIRDLQ